VEKAELSCLEVVFDSEPETRTPCGWVVECHGGMICNDCPADKYFYEMPKSDAMKFFKENGINVTVMEE